MRARDPVLALIVALAARGVDGSSAQVSKKLPEPHEAVQKDAEKRIKEAFQSEYAARKPAEKRALARKLIETARETRSDPGMKFVLLREARDIAADSGDARQSMLIIDDMALWFTVSDLEMRVAALEACGKKADEPADLEALVRESLPLLDAALDRLDAAAGKRLVEAAKGAARKAQNPWLMFHVEERRDLVLRLDASRKEVVQAQGKLKEAPSDPEASRTLGEIQCFQLGRWKAGLPHLARANDVGLRRIAGLDLEEPGQVERQAALAGEWWTFAEGTSRREVKDACRERAFHWYQKALPGLSGISRVEVEKRLAEKPRRSLSDFQEVDARVGHGEFGKGGKLGGASTGDIEVNGIGSPGGLYMHGTHSGFSRVTYKLGRRYKKLEAFVALNDSSDRPWSHSTFIVEGDGRTLWKSKPIGERGKPQQCSVSIGGIDALTLLVHCPGHHHMAHAVWLEPVVVK
jgi:hypothetical protein